VIIVGLTGSIAMGKSTVAAMFEAEGALWFDSDAAVHAFYRGPGAQTIETLFPGVLVEGAIDRNRLAQRVLGDSVALAQLEGVVHPAVAKARQEFLFSAALKGRRLVVIDIPLLFESGAEGSVDVILVVSASETVQKARALAREGMTLDRFDKIIARQIPDKEKRRRAHMTIDTNGVAEATRAQVRGFIRCVASLAGKRVDLHA
jgi:dephospho-CoA kinase